MVLVCGTLCVGTPHVLARGWQGRALDGASSPCSGVHPAGWAARALPHGYRSLERVCVCVRVRACARVRTCVRAVRSPGAECRLLHARAGRARHHQDL